MMFSSIKGLIVENVAGLLYPFFSHRLGLYVMSDEETIEFIIKNRASVSRFGDGELTLMKGGKEGFQDYDVNLSKKLYDVMNTPNDNVLVCIPVGLTKVDQGYTKSTTRFWKAYTVLNFKALLQNINQERAYYGNTNFSRFYMEFSDKSWETAKKKVDSIKKIWEARDVYLIEGEYTRSGAGNDLYDNANSLNRIICPATNAFSKYEEIIAVVKEKVSKANNPLILCCLGPTATCLAYDLHMLGYQALDLGHMDIEYEWAKLGCKSKQPIIGKAVNEVGNNNPTENFVNEKYNKEIIATII